MPTRAIKDDHAMVPRLNHGTDFGQMVVHHGGVDARKHNSGSDITGWANRPKEIRPLIAQILEFTWSAAFVGPDPRQASLLADAGFVLPPDLDRFASGRLRDGSCDQRCEVFLCASSASPSWRGC